MPRQVPSPTPSSSQTLVAFGILTSNWEEKRISYIQNFTPLVAHCLAVDQRPIVNESDVKAGLQDQFGLDLPAPVIRTILKRAVKEGLLRREGQALVATRLVAGQDISRRRMEVERSLNGLVDSLIEYLDDTFGLRLDREEAEGALLAFVAERAIPILRASIHGEEFRPTVLTEDQYEYAIARFVAHLSQRDPVNFEALETAVKGSMLAAAMYLPGASPTGRKVSDLRVYLDTPFLIGLVGYSAGETQDAALELVELLQNLGAKPSCFRHTFVETRNVFMSAAGQLTGLERRPGRASNHSPLVEHCLRHGITATELEIRVEQLGELLEELGVEVCDTPEYSAEITVDEPELERVLQEYVGYRSETARTYDVRSLTAIYRSRRGRREMDLDTAKAIFATPNGAVVGASRKFFDERPDGNHIPISAVDHELATVAWLRRPLLAPDLPRKQLIADCYAAAQPNEDLWSCYLVEIDRMSDSFTERDYATLRYSVEARRSLMSETLGDPDAITVSTISTVLESVREAYRDEGREEQRVRGQAQEGEIGTARSEIDRLELDAQGLRANHRRELDALRQEPGRVARRKAERRAARIGRALTWLVVLVLFVGFLGGLLVDIGTLWVRVLILFAVGAAAVVATYGAVSERGVGSSIDRLEYRIAERLYRRALRSYRTELEET